MLSPQFSWLYAILTLLHLQYASTERPTMKKNKYSLSIY